ncbi:choice-of-anchor Q domain-containing protein, partial [Chloroflexota bacterium]
SPAISYSDVGWSAGIYPGSGNINADPLFVSPGTGDFHLQSGSPAIDSADNSVAPPDDIDGDARPFDGDGDSVAVADMGADELFTAVVTTYTLTVNTAGSGTVGKSPDQADYPDGTPVLLTAEPDPGWSFSHWSGDLSGSTNPETITMNGDKTVTATFTQDLYTLNIYTEGSGSVTVNATGPYTYGASVNLTAIPATGWSFSHWSDDLSGLNNPETIIMDEDKTVTATFVENYTLTISTIGSGTVGKSPDQADYPDGTPVLLTAVAVPGWSFDSWSGDLFGSTNPETITMDGDKTVTATFTQNQNQFQTFVISTMTIDWAKDKEENEGRFSRWYKWFKPEKDKFSISGRIQLPEGVTLDDLQPSATLLASIGDALGSQAVDFGEWKLRRNGTIWHYRSGKHSDGDGITITRMTIYWAPERDGWAGWAGFKIDGELDLPEGIEDEAGTEATVVIEIPTAGGFSITGEETIEFDVSKNGRRWSYYVNPRLPRFRYEP